MANLPNTFNFGDSKDMQIEELVEKLQRMYEDVAVAVNSKPDVYERTTDGQATDTFLPQGSININTSTNRVQMLTNHLAASVTWTTLS